MERNCVGSYASALDCGGGVRAIFYADSTIGIEHRCRDIGEGDWLVCAPRLQLEGGHEIVSRDPLTVSPSILCPDCGLHGYIRSGEWQSV